MKAIIARKRARLTPMHHGVLCCGEWLLCYGCCAMVAMVQGRSSGALLRRWHKSMSYQPTAAACVSVYAD